MPGLVAILGQGPAEQRARLLSGMLSTLRHEMDYVSGELSFPEQGIWAGWMARPGSFAHHLSCYRHLDGSALIFCGECFPSCDGLDAGSFVTPDQFGAAVIEGYRAHGPQFLRRLNGLFSGLLIDRTLGSCVVFNDRFGSERLYRHEARGAVWLASEAKAILYACPDTRALVPESVAQFLKFGSVLDGSTLFRGIELLPGGSYLLACGSDELVEHRYFAAREWEDQASLSWATFVESLAESLTRVVPRYVRGGLPVGISVTGGLDTRMIMAALPKICPPPKCYTFGGLSGETLDERIGRQVAANSGLSHETLHVDASWLQGFSRSVDRTIWISDGCAGATTAHEIHLTRLGAGVAPVRVTGNYGSETLRGMSTLKTWTPVDGLLAHGFVEVFRDAAFQRHLHPITQAAFLEVPLHLFGSLVVGRSQVTCRAPFLDNELVALAYRAPLEALQSAEPSLRAVASMSPELARIPTDRGLSWGAGRVAAAARHAVAAVSFKLDYLDADGLPGPLWPMDYVLRALRHTPLLGQHKYLAYRRWFKSELFSQLHTTLAEAEGLDSYFDKDWRRTAVHRHATGRANLLRPIGAAVTLAGIERLLLRSERFRQANGNGEQ